MFSGNQQSELFNYEHIVPWIPRSVNLTRPTSLVLRPTLYIELRIDLINNKGFNPLRSTSYEGQGMND